MNDLSQLPAQHPGIAPSTGVSAQAAARDQKLDPKLVTAAHQFEASLMQELLKPLSSGNLFGENDEEDGAGGGLSSLTSSAEGSGSALMSFGSEALAKALSEKGGLGIARQILDHFEAIAGSAAESNAANEKPTATGDLAKPRAGVKTDPGSNRNVQTGMKSLSITKVI